MRLFILVAVLGLPFLLHGQDQENFSISGRVLDADDSQPIIGATVQFINIKDSLKSKFAVTDIEGFYKLSISEQAFYRLYVRSVGYESASSIMRLKQSIDLGVISLVPDVQQLHEVEIAGEVVPVEQIGDTTQYNAAAYKTHADASGAELVAKMPGIIVDDSGVSANGEAIEQVLVDGKRFFGTDPLLSLHNVPAEVIDKVQVYDELSDRAKFTGYDDGNTVKTMNVITKTDRRNGEFGRLYAGYGTDSRHSVGGSVNSFNGDRRISLMGMSNNINQQDFSNEDLAGISTGGGRGGGRGTGGAGFTANQSASGITATNSAGLNYSDQWGDNTSIEASYFYNQSDNELQQRDLRTTNVEGTAQTYDESVKSATENSNHRVQLRLDHEISENSKVLIRSNFNTQDNQQEELTVAQTFNDELGVINGTDNTYQSVNETYTLANSIIYQQKLNDVGRTFQASIDHNVRPINRYNTFQDVRADSMLTYDVDLKTSSYTGSLRYTEPVGNFSQLEVDYQFNQNDRISNIETTDFDIGNDQSALVEGLSGNFSSGYTTHRPSVGFGYRNYEKFINVRLSYQNALLTLDQELPIDQESSRRFNNLMLTVTARLPVGSNGNLFWRYNTSTSAPSASQLQEVVDNRSPLFLSIGNSFLDQSYTHSLMGRIQLSFPDVNMTLANFTMVQQTSDYIGQATTFIRADTTIRGVSALAGAQLSQPVNLDGYWSLRNSTTFGKLISPLKSNLNSSVTLGYTRLPGMINNVKNYANTLSGGLRLVLASNISEQIDFNLFTSHSANRVTTQSASDSRYVTSEYGGKINLTFFKSLVFRSNIAHLSYMAVNSSGDVNYTLWNMSLAKKVFKKRQGELEFTVFDLLGQNQSVSQSVTNSYVQETTTDVLQTYFMLKFTYQIRNFHG